MRALWLADVLRGAGLMVSEYEGWETRGAELESIQCVLWHHTAEERSSADLSSLSILVNGRKGPTPLPGPLAQLGLGRSGRWYVVASGKANHAGVGKWNGVNHSAHTIGIEAANDGIGEPWSAVQMDSYVRGTAAILRHLGLTEDALCAHREWATPKGRKIDPTGVDMVAVRRQLHALLAAGSEEDHMDAAQSEEALNILRDLKAEVLSREDDGNLWKLARNMHYQIMVPEVGLQRVLALLLAENGGAPGESLHPQEIADAIVAAMSKIDAEAIVGALIDRLKA